MDTQLELPEGRRECVGKLAKQLLLEKPGPKLVYATDFAESEANIQTLIGLAQGAHTLFCESSFLVEEREHAQRTKHLTTQSCARIANEANVRQLVPFHFSHRYEKCRDKVYTELERLSNSRVYRP